MDPHELRQLIAIKRDGGALSAANWAAITAGYVAGSVDEAQLAALLMAATLQGLDSTETIALTAAMVASGDVLTYRRHPILDKHSSGGVGDTVSLLAVPIAAAAGVRVAKLAGRGLGHTGGTIDKLEVLPGLRTDLRPERFVEQVETLGCAIGAQSARLVPADRLIYALRDRTATVPSIGLIAASIVSKKIAAGADIIVYDVKVGRGAFMHDLNEARLLAQRIAEVTKSFGRGYHIFITDMDEPLGRMIGDGLETLEAIGILQGERRNDDRLPQLALRCAQTMIDLAGLDEQASDLLSSGRAWSALEGMLRAQGADIAASLSLKPAQPQCTLYAREHGYIAEISPVQIGEAARELVRRFGPFAGLELHVQVGDNVNIGDPLLTVYGNATVTDYVECLVLSKTAPLRRPLVAFEERA